MPDNIKARLKTILPYTREEKKKRGPTPLDLSALRMDSDASASEIGGDSGIGAGAGAGDGRAIGGRTATKTATLPRYYSSSSRKREQERSKEVARDDDKKKQKEAKYLFYINLGLFLLGWLFFWVPVLAVVFDASALVASVVNYYRHGRHGSTYGMASGVMGLIHFVLLFAYVILATLVGMFGQYFAGGFFGPIKKK